MKSKRVSYDAGTIRARVSDELLKRFEDYCATRKRKDSDVLREAVVEYLDRMEFEEKLKHAERTARLNEKTSPQKGKPVIEVSDDRMPDDPNSKGQKEASSSLDASRKQKSPGNSRQT